MATYLLTGAAGFIASKVGELLLKDGHTIIGIDNLNDAYDVRLKQWRLEQLKNKEGFEFHPLDITDKEALQTLLVAPRAEPVSAIINLAARAGVRQSVENPWVYYETNTIGTLNLLELCRIYDINKFILASTSSLYGKDNVMPYQEDQSTDRPLSPYASSKKAAEALCFTYHHLYGIDVTIPRYFTVYGPAGRPDMSLFRFVQWISEGHPVTIFGNGKQSRDFTYVDDIARGTIAALKPVGYEIVNLGSDTPVVLSDAVQKVEQALGKKANLVYKSQHPADVMATWADIGKAEILLGWRPQYSLQAGIEKLVAWYQANREWAKTIRTE